MTRSAKRTTSQDVARLAGVSRTTVSFVLNDRPGQAIPEETRRRVLEAARRLDYRPHASARSLAAGRSDIVLLAIPDLPIGAGISRFAEELAASLAEHDLTLVTHLESAHGRPLVDVCAAVGASAVVGFESFDQETIEALHSVGAVVAAPSRPRALGSTGHFGRLQAEHLIDRGHRRLGYALPTDPSLLAVAEERLRGATEVCLARGAQRPFALSTGLDIAEAAANVAAWTRESVTGICAFNDEVAIAILAGMHAHGLTAPSDLAVIGADDIPCARVTVPPLTTVAFDLHEVGRLLAAVVAAALAGQEAGPNLADPTVNLIQRASS